MKVKRESYLRARDVEQIADLCWRLSDLLSDNFVGYESDVYRLHAIAFEFEKKFETLVDSYYA